ncbi:hypothetical protein B0H14DRAFT_3467877 [Mycena olivaceomarginata]|nr:hypothetical protein B0H14DRAFT_3467877 [Mycena olivaceomarginata]
MHFYLGNRSEPSPSVVYAQIGICQPLLSQPEAWSDYALPFEPAAAICAQQISHQLARWLLRNLSIEPGSGIATKLDLIQADSPWFFNMWNLIAARPTLQPVGLGNNDSPFDIDLLLRTHDGDDASSAAADDTADLPSQLSDAVKISDDSDDDDKDLVAVTKKRKADDFEPKDDSTDDKELLVGQTLAGSVKRKRKTVDSNPKDEKPAKKTKPQPATSLPAPPALAVAKKPTNAKDRFSATILAEEETAQLVLGLRREKNTAQKEVTLAKIHADTVIRLAKAKAKADTKREERAAKLEIVHLKMQYDQLHMAQMQHAGPSSMSFMGAGFQRLPATWISDTAYPRTRPSMILTLLNVPTSYE